MGDLQWSYNRELALLAGLDPLPPVVEALYQASFASECWLPSSVADPDPGSGAFWTPGSGIRNRFFPDPGSDHYF